MKKQKMFFGLCMIFILYSPFIQAIQPMQTSNKLYLTPFYNTNWNNGAINNYTVMIDTPDGLTSIQNAMITFEVYMSPTVNINLTVNDKSCTPNIFQVSTTFMTSGRGTISYDCSNIINQKGLYNIKIKTDKNTGSSYGWIDVTYTNNPIPELKVHGTEYMIGQYGRTFLQLLDNNQQPIKNTSCYTTIVNPNLTLYTNNTLMTSSVDGLYFYDINPIPSSTGIYMVSAYCTIPSNTNIHYIDDFECGGLSCGSTNWNTSWIQINPTISVATTFSIDNYALTVDGTLGEAERNFTINNCSTGNSAYITFWATTEGIEAGRNCDYRYYNGTGYTTLLRLNNTNSVANDYHYYSYEICKYTGTSGIKSFDVVKSAGAKNCYLDNVDIALTTAMNLNNYQIIRGAGELHVNPVLNTSVISDAVWNATNRTLTFYQNFSIAQIDLTNYSRIESYTNISQQTIITFLQSMNNTIMTTLLNIPSNVWSYITRTLTFYPNVTINTSIVSVINTSVISQTVYFNVTNTTVNITQQFVAVNNISVNVTQQIVSVDNVSIILQNQTVSVQNISVNITQQYVAINNISLNTSMIASEVWNYTTRNLTYYQNFTQPQTDMTNYTRIVYDVWNYVGRYIHGTLI